MHVQDPSSAVAFATHARPAKGNAARAGVAPTESPSDLHAAAFAVLGIESALHVKPGSFAEPAGDAKGLERLAAAFKEAVASTKAAQPGISDANARHIARYKTIVENRSSFPPDSFSLHTELANGTSITTKVPAAGGFVEPARPVLSLSPNGAVMEAGGAARAPLTDAQVEAAYKEWL